MNYIYSIKSLLSIRILMLLVFSVLYNANAQDWKAKWISMNLAENDKTNVWIGFAKEVNVDNVPKKALAKIAVDSKYWLYINGN